MKKCSNSFSLKTVATLVFSFALVLIAVFHCRSFSEKNTFLVKGKAEDIFWENTNGTHGPDFLFFTIEGKKYFYCNIGGNRASTIEIQNSIEEADEIIIYCTKSTMWLNYLTVGDCTQVVKIAADGYQTDWKEHNKRQIALRVLFFVIAGLLVAMVFFLRWLD